MRRVGYAHGDPIPYGLYVLLEPGENEPPGVPSDLQQLDGLLQTGTDRED